MYVANGENLQTPGLLVLMYNILEFLEKLLGNLGK